MENSTKTYSVEYLLYLAITLLLFFPSHSLWHFFNSLTIISRPLSYLLSFIVIYRSLRKYPANQLLIIFSFLGIVVINAFLSGWYYGEMLWHLFVLIIGAKELSFDKIVKFHLYIEICFCVINILAFEFELTDKQLVFLEDEREDMFGDDIINRLSLGYPAATDFATHIFYMLLDYWILRKGMFNKIELIANLFVIFLIVHYCDARQASACIFLIIIFSIYIYRKTKSKKPIGYIFSCFLIFGVPCFFCLSLYATLSFDDSNIYWLGFDTILSHRLRYGHDAIQEFGLGWFGNTIELFGGGKAGGFNEYNYVDCAYIQFLLRWGILMMAFFMLAFVKICRDAVLRNDLVLLFAIFVAGVSSVITQFLFFPNYCVLLLGLMAAYNPSNKNVTSVKGLNQNKKKIYNEDRNIIISTE